jgi:hypothetical protein
MLDVRVEVRSRKNVSAIERLEFDQGHLHPKLEVPRLKSLGREPDSVLRAIRNIYCTYEPATVSLKSVGDRKQRQEGFAFLRL